MAATLEEVAEAAHQKGVDYDAVVIIRGGGSGTDLLLFDRYEIAAAVAACPFPVLAGIGHQKNESITDMMAHTSLKTPTKVAEYIIQHNRTFEQELLRNTTTAIIKNIDIPVLARVNAAPLYFEAGPQLSVRAGGTAEVNMIMLVPLLATSLLAKLATKKTAVPMNSA